MQWLKKAGMAKTQGRCCAHMEYVGCFQRELGKTTVRAFRRHLAVYSAVLGTGLEDAIGGTDALPTNDSGRALLASAKKKLDIQKFWDFENSDMYKRGMNWIVRRLFESGFEPRRLTPDEVRSNANRQGRRGLLDNSSMIEILDGDLEGELKRATKGVIECEPSYCYITVMAKFEKKEGETVRPLPKIIQYMPLGTRLANMHMIYSLIAFVHDKRALSFVAPPVGPLGMPLFMKDQSAFEHYLIEDVSAWDTRVVAFYLELEAEMLLDLFKNDAEACSFIEAYYLNVIGGTLVFPTGEVMLTDGMRLSGMLMTYLGNSILNSVQMAVRAEKAGIGSVEEVLAGNARIKLLASGDDSVVRGDPEAVALFAAELEH